MHAHASFLVRVCPQCHRACSHWTLVVNVCIHFFIPLASLRGALQLASRWDLAEGYHGITM